MDRIPLSASDFSEGSYTKVAKFFMKQWPDAQSRPSLSRAQNLLAQILGYRDLHDAQRSAVHSFQAQATYNLSEQFLFPRLFDFFESPGIDLYAKFDSPEPVEAFIESIPFRHLSFLGSSRCDLPVARQLTNAFLDAYKLRLLSHDVEAETNLHSLPACVAFAYKPDHPAKELTSPATIADVLGAAYFPGGLNVLDFVCTDLHKAACELAFEDCFCSDTDTPYSRGWFGKAVDSDRITSLRDPNNLAYLFSLAEDELLNEVITQPWSYAFNKKKFSVTVPFCSVRNLPQHSSAAVSLRYGSTDETPASLLSASGKWPKLIDSDKATMAKNFSKQLSPQPSRHEFDIRHVAVSDNSPVDLYTWRRIQRDPDGELILIAKGLMFSSAPGMGLSDGAVMSLGESCCGPDGYDAGISVVDLIPGFNAAGGSAAVEVRASIPHDCLVVVQRFERCLRSRKGSGMALLKDTLRQLRTFIGLDMAVSMIVRPSQVINYDLAPGMAKMLAVQHHVALGNRLKNRSGIESLAGVSRVIYPYSIPV